MAWNEPGGGKDPWGSGQGNGPPDLDEALKKIRDKFSKFGGKNGGGSGGAGGTSGGRGFIPVIAVVLLILWVFAGTYQVDEKERAVVLRFGKYLDTVNPGLHWNPPLIDTVIKERVTEERQYRNKTRDLMLTEDENIVELQLGVQYNIKDIKDYVLNVKNPENSLEHATNSALRHVVGSTGLNEVISTG
ncbi:MAG: protease modulator HflK, partial [Porticoccaceae bacterium]|nr:protease modulator HflK [Porticoccaceae bacterium]